MKQRTSVVMSVDIGQKREPTAICVAEIDQRPKGQREVTHFVVRHLERLPAGTTYPQTAQRLSEIALNLRQKNVRNLCLYVDATGLGQPIIDLLKQEATAIPKVIGVFFTHGDQRAQEGKQIRLGKAFLVSRLQTLLQSGHLHLPDTSEAKNLARELQDYEIQVVEDANERYGAFQVGTKDDLVTALGMAVQKVPLLRAIY